MHMWSATTKKKFNVWRSMTIILTKCVQSVSLNNSHYYFNKVSTYSIGV